MELIGVEAISPKVLGSVNRGLDSSLPIGEF